MISLSSAHGLRIRGAKGPAPWGLDEVDESRRVVDRVLVLLRGAGIAVRIFHDDKSTNQSANLTAITSWHLQRAADLHASLHFNAYKVTDAPRGTEVLHR